MGTSFFRALLLASASVSMSLAAIPATAHAQEASFQFDIPAQPMDNALRALGRVTKKNILFDKAVVRGKRSTAVRGRMSAGEALAKMLSGSGLRMASNQRGFVVQAAARNDAVVPLSAVTVTPTSAKPVKSDSRIVGQVTDGETGRRLQGALVRVVGTGQSARTDEQGNYQIYHVAPGAAQISVSFIGYPEAVLSVEVDENSELTVPVLLGTGQDIVVYGTRSARSLALNKERTADNSQTVVSSDLIGQFNGTTISDALRRAPGVAFERDNNTGDGSNIIVRGLPSAYNQVLINGQQLPVGSGTDRNPNLNNILAGSISKVTINKTLLPSQDSAGTGGLIEIETASPLDRPKRYASFGAERLWRGKGFGDEYLLSGVIAGRLADNFAVSLSYQRRKQTVFNFGYRSSGVLPEYLPLDAQGQPIEALDFIDPRTPFPYEDSPGAADIYPGLTINGTRSRSKTDAYTAALEWEPFEGTNWKFDYLYSKRATDTASFNYAVTMFTNYVLTPIPALDGELRYARNGIFASRSLQSSTSNTRDATHSATFRGTSTLGQLTLNYEGGYSRASNRIPVAYDGNFFIPTGPGSPPFNTSLALPEAVNPNTGRLSSFFGPQVGRDVPQLLLTPEGLAAINDPNGFVLSNLNSRGIAGKSTIKSLAMSAKYDLSRSIFDYVQAGVRFNGNTSRAEAISAITYAPTFTPTYPFYPSAGELGIAFGPVGFENILGNASQLQIPGFRSFADFTGRIPQVASDGVFLTPFADPITPPIRTGEDELAAYIEAKIDIGKFSAVGGVRFSQVDVTSDFLRRASIQLEDGSDDAAFAAANTIFVTEKAKQQTWLPRLLLNYRPTDDLVFRAGYFSTTARPQLSLLTTAQDVRLSLTPFYGPNFDQPLLEIQKGNPDLKPSSVHNFDIAVERYFGSVGAIKAAAYVKLFKNLVESSTTSGIRALDGVDLPDDPRFQTLPADIFISGSQPYNAEGTAKAWGAELSVERQLDFVPWLKGFGIYANYTYSGSSKTQPFTWFSAPVYDADGNLVGREQVDFEFKGVPFDGQPEHSGTLGLTYNRSGIDASLYYTLQARRRVQFLGNNLHTFDEANDTLDLRVQYVTKRFGPTMRLYLLGNNLLKGRGDPNSQTSAGGIGNTPKYYLSGNYLGGRTITAGLSVDF